MKKLTYRILQAKGACKGQVDLFKELFPKGAEVSVDVAISVANKFDFFWAAFNLLSDEGYHSFNKAVKPLMKAYDKAETPLLKAYLEAVAKLFAEIYIKENLK